MNQPQEPKKGIPDIHTLSGGGGGGDSALNERVARIEERLNHLASSKELEVVRHDITKLKVWILVGMLAGIGIASGIIISIVKLFLS